MIKNYPIIYDKCFKILNTLTLYDKVSFLLHIICLSIIFTREFIYVNFKNKKHIRALALKNFNATLFYSSKKPLYHYTIPFYNIFTSQTSTSLFYSLK